MDIPISGSTVVGPTYVGISVVGVVFYQAHAMKTVLLKCRTVFLACGCTKSSVLFLHHRPILHPTLFLKENVLLVTLLSLHNIIKLHSDDPKLGWINGSS